MTRPPPPNPSLAAAIEASLDLFGHLLGNVDRLVESAIRDSQEVAGDARSLYRTAMERAGLARDTVKATPRMIRIVSEGMRIIAAYRIHETRAGYASDEVARRRLEALHGSSAARLYRLCVELRGGVLKLGQFLSCRMDLLPAAYVAELAKLRDQVPPVDAGAIRERLESELGASIESVFAELDGEPIAAASLAQVHRAVLRDGTPVAVKIQVPGIEEIIETDITALEILARVAGDLVGGDVATVCRELGRSVRRELDFAAEADNLRELGRAFASDRDVVVPRPIDGLVTSRLLVMELIDGRRLTDFLDAAGEADEAGRRDRDRLLAILIRSFCRQILELGRFQADPHPGNFLVLPGPRLALLDLGSLATLSPGTRIAYGQIAAAVLGGDHAAVARLLGELGFRTADGKGDALVELAELLLEAFREGMSDLSGLDARAQFERILELARDNPVIAFPDEFVQLGRVFASLGGLIMHYKPSIDIYQLIAPYLASAFAGGTRQP